MVVGRTRNRVQWPSQCHSDLGRSEPGQNRRLCTGTGRGNKGRLSPTQNGSEAGSASPASMPAPGQSPSPRLSSASTALINVHRDERQCALERALRSEAQVESWEGRDERDLGCFAVTFIRFGVRQWRGGGQTAVELPARPDVGCRAPRRVRPDEPDARHLMRSAVDRPGIGGDRVAAVPFWRFWAMVPYWHGGPCCVGAINSYDRDDRQFQLAEARGTAELAWTARGDRRSSARRREHLPMQ